MASVVRDFSEEKGIGPRSFTMERPVGAEQDPSSRILKATRS